LADLKMKVCPSCASDAGIQSPRCERCGADLSKIGPRTGNALTGIVLDGKYRLEELIGEGAMGWIYRGIHLKLENSLAFKVLKPSGAQDTKRVRRFEQEARAASRLKHPNIISIIDFGRSPGGLLYIVSEYLDGVTLGNLVTKNGPLPLDRAMRIFDQILSAVEDAHSHQIVHRDLKPDNIIILQMRTGEDFIKVIDFGIALLTDPSSDQPITLDGHLCGTPAYMSPEQLRGEELTPRSDLYSCGLILFEMLTGREAFLTDSVAELVYKHLFAAPPTLHEAAPKLNLPPQLEAIVARALVKDQERRFENASEFRRAIRPFLSPGAIETYASARRPPTPAVSTTVIPRPVTGPALPRTPLPQTLDSVPTSTLAARLAGVDPSLGFKTLPFMGGASPSQTLRGVGPDTVEAERFWGPALGLDAIASRETLDLAPAPEPLPRTVPTPELAPIIAASSGPRPAAAPRASVLGRDPELERIALFFDGGDPVLEIVGHPGIGKTTLLGEASRIAEGMGFLCFEAEPDPTLSQTPWFPIRTLIARGLGLEPAEASAGALRARAQMIGLPLTDVGWLAQIFDPPPREEELPDVAIRLHEITCSALRVLLGAAPRVAFLVDDADLLDGASRRFLGELCAAVNGTTAKVVVASGSSVLPATGPQLSLYPSPLRTRDIEALVASRVPGFEQDPDRADFLSRLALYSRGNPLHVVAASILLAQRGSREGGPLASTIEVWASSIPDDALRLLRLVSVLGRSVPLDFALELFDSASGIEEPLRILASMGLVVDEEMTDSVTLAHPLLGEIVRDTMPSDLRQALHRRVLAALSERGGNAILLSKHALEAKLGEQGLDILEAAGDLARSWLDDEGAACTHFTGALRVARWELLLPPESRRCLLLSLKLGLSLVGSGQHFSAEVVLKEGMGQARGDEGLQARMRSALARLFLAKAHHKEALDAIYEAARQAISSGDNDIICEVYFELVDLLAEVGALEKALGEGEEGVMMVTAGEGPTALAGPKDLWRLLVRLAAIQQQQGDLEVASMMASGALRHAKRVASVAGEAWANLLLFGVLERLGQRRAAETHLDAATELYHWLGDRQSLARCLLARATQKPRTDSAMVRQALDLSEQIGWLEGIEEARRLVGRK
jgi:serine/threonine protein kinase/tetratricopeptide (TPR) repeat protein